MHAKASNFDRPNQRVSLVASKSIALNIKGLAYRPEKVEEMISQLKIYIQVNFGKSRVALGK